MSKEIAHSDSGEFKNNNEMMEMFMIYDERAWKHRRNNFDIVKTKIIYANGEEIKLSSDVFLLNELIICCAFDHGDESISMKHILRSYVSKVEFLNNGEKKGAAIVLTISSRSFRKLLKIWLGLGSSRCNDGSFSKLILTIPIMNSSSESIYGITCRLHEFCNPSPNSGNSYKIPFEIINFYQLEIRVSPFGLKPITYTSNESCGEQFIVFMKNNYSIETSNMILSNFILKMRKPVKSSLGDNVSLHLRTIKNSTIFEKFASARMFKSVNAETNETCYVHGKAFCSLFRNEWLHSDIIDSYLNRWRLRMKKLVTDFLNTDKTCYKIYNTSLYTRLTKEMTCNSTLNLDEDSLHQLQINARRISGEEIYLSLPVFTSIFDFNFLIVPINASNHWLTGIIYQPKNCLKHKFAGSSMETGDNDWTYIIIYDSLISNLSSKCGFYTFVLTQYIKACLRSLKEKDFKNDFYFDEGKIKTVTLKGTYRQDNKNDGGLFMVEFIRQVCLNPDSLEKLIRGQSMKNVFPTFNASSGRSYLKSYVYSKFNLKEWSLLYEMEEYYLTQYCKQRFERLRTRYYECVGRSGKKNIRRTSIRSIRYSV
uniref:ULP_PROTEASE domain-containing protein n=1 Tax=Strongyloides papillosus TaxID=174720 RepID=A0A0N5BI95_STREA